MSREYVNTGPSVVVRAMGQERTLLTADHLVLADDVPDDVAWSIVRDHPDVVPVASRRAVAYMAALAAQDRAERALVDDMRTMARRWLDAHPVPDYVLWYLQEDDGNTP